MALSAVDNVLGISGAQFGVPVSQLLESHAEEVRVYGSCLGYSVETGKAGARQRIMARDSSSAMVSGI